MLKCLVDMDGVLVDFVGGMCKAHGICDPYLDPENHGKYDILGSGVPAFWKPADSHTFWEGLEPTPEAFEILRIIEDFFEPQNICILTSPTLAPESLAGKLLWIKKHIPKYARQYLMGPAKHFCANGRHVLVDDYDKNVDAFRAAGGQAILIPRIWNSSHVLKDQATSILKNTLAMINDVSKRTVCI